jgi:SAM-dependent methyltransferase
MGYFADLPRKIRDYVRWKKSGQLSWKGYVPSQTHIKYPKGSTFGGRRVLNVGCGKSTFQAPNVTNIDLHPSAGVDIVCDLSKPLPFKDDEFDFILANHILEHVPDWWECFKELARVLKVGGKIEVWVPPISSESAFTYRDHINYIGIESFTGVGGMYRAGVNLAAEVELLEKGLQPYHQLQVIYMQRNVLCKWWIWFAPDFVKTWMTDHLRGVVSEEGYIFQKQGGSNGA